MSVMMKYVEGKVNMFIYIRKHQDTMDALQEVIRVVRTLLKEIESAFG